MALWPQWRAGVSSLETGRKNRSSASDGGIWCLSSPGVGVRWMAASAETLRPETAGRHRVGPHGAGLPVPPVAQARQSSGPWDELRVRRKQDSHRGRGAGCPGRDVQQRACGASEAPAEHGAGSLHWDSCRALVTREALRASRAPAPASRLKSS